MTYFKYRYKLARHSLTRQEKYQEPEEVAGDRLDDIDKPSEPDSGLSRFPPQLRICYSISSSQPTSSNPEKYIVTVRPPSPSRLTTRLSPPGSGPLDFFAERYQGLPNLKFAAHRTLRVSRGLINRPSSASFCAFCS